MTEIVRGPRPGAIGRIAQLHGEYYASAWRFDATFEAYVAREVADFVTRFDAGRDGLWLAVRDGAIEGSIAIMDAATPRLRWFLVSDAIRGQGIGKALMREAMAFCDERGYRCVELGTFRGLDAAIALYEAHGFRLVEEHEADRWGARILEQRFVREVEARS